jgi:hypothetical protein
MMGAPVAQCSVLQAVTVPLHLKAFEKLSRMLLFWTIVTTCL